MDRTYDGSPKLQGATRACRRRPADLAIATLADQLAIQKAKKDANSFSGVLFLFFFGKSGERRPHHRFANGPLHPSIPRSCSAHRLRTRTRVWAAKMVAAESWRLPPLSLQCALEFTRAFSCAIVQQANSR